MRSHRTGEPPSAPATFRPVRPVPYRRRWFRQWPFLLVFAGIAASLVVVATDHFLRGTLLLSATVLMAAVLRLTLPTRKAGLLAVRSRLIDVIVLGGLGAGLLTLALNIPEPS